MPAKSEKQATAARIALQVKKGKQKAKPGSASAKMAKSMTKKQLKDFTKKESVRLIDDVMVETSIGMQIIPAGTIVTEVAWGKEKWGVQKQPGGEAEAETFHDPGRTIKKKKKMEEMAVTTGDVAFVPGCETPGRKIRSKGKGRGLARGKGRGPRGIPPGEEDEELEENSNSQVSRLQLDH